MNSIRDHVRAVIGGAKKSGITDKEIDDASWEYYFDLDQTMDHILGLPVAYESNSGFSYWSQRFKESGTQPKKDKVTYLRLYPCPFFCAGFRRARPIHLLYGDSARLLLSWYLPCNYVFLGSPETPETPTERTLPPVPLSALQRLSLANKSQMKPTSLASLAKGAQKPEMAGVTPPLSRLASLARTTPSPSTSSGASPTRSTQITPPKAPSKLASLAASGKAAATASPLASSPTSPSLSKLAQRINASRQAESQPATSPSSAEITMVIDPLFLPLSKDVEPLKAKKPSAFGAVLALPTYLSHTQNNKKVAEIAVKKAAMSDTFTFNTPSPDDIVLNARRGTSLASRVR